MVILAKLFSLFLHRYPVTKSDKFLFTIIFDRFNLSKLILDKKITREDLKDFHDTKKNLCAPFLYKNNGLNNINSAITEFKNKVDSILITHDIRINNTMNDIDALRNKYDTGSYISNNTFQYINDKLMVNYMVITC